MNMSLFTPLAHPGRLIVVEGIDGSGKSTQLMLLKKYLESEGYPTVMTEWNSSDLVKKATKGGKKEKALTPTTFSLLHATDFAHRFHYSILPPLKAGMIVLADRYIFTAYARDGVRGIDPVWVRNLYQFAVKPDIAFYFRVPIDVAIKRLLAGRAKLKWYEAGMDLGLTPDLQESFRMFQTRILEMYEQMIPEVGLNVIDATGAVNEQQKLMREQVRKSLEGYTVRRRIYAARRL